METTTTTTVETVGTLEFRTDLVNAPAAQFRATFVRKVGQTEWSQTGLQVLAAR